MFSPWRLGVLVLVYRLAGAPRKQANL